MKKLIQGSIWVAGVALLVLGCNKEPTVQSAAADLEKAFKTGPATAPAPTAPAPASAEQNQVTPPPPAGDQAKQLVHEAVVAIQTNGYIQAFNTLRAAQVAPNITVDQYSAIESTRLALERDMAAKALAGDQSAQGALDTIRRMPR
jgi:hypothetical protein